VLGSEQLCEQLLADTGVAVLPGSAFGRPVEEMTFRLAYVDFDGDSALKSAAQSSGQLSDAWVDAHCARLVTAVNRICGWLSDDVGTSSQPLV
jgi:aspartate aminotransferase